MRKRLFGFFLVFTQSFAMKPALSEKHPQKLLWEANQEPSSCEYRTSIKLADKEALKNLVIQKKEKLDSSNFKQFLDDALFFAHYEKRTEIELYLIQEGADVNAMQSDGVPFFFKAFTDGPDELVEYVCKKAKFKSRDTCCRTLLHYLMDNKTYKKSHILQRMAIENGVNPWKKDIYKRRIFSKTSSPHYTRLKRFALLEYAKKGRKRKVKSVSRSLHDRSLEARVASGKNKLLHSAAKSRLNRLAALLLSRKVFSSPQNQKGLTPLHYAVFNDDVVMGSLLLRSGADILAKDKKGFSPLDYVLNRVETRMYSQFKVFFSSLERRAEKNGDE